MTKSSGLNLPSHVEVRQKQKADGALTTYFYFGVRKARQEEWRKLRRLPIEESKRTGNADAQELAAVFKDAHTLTQRYERETSGLDGPVPGTIPWLIARFDETVEQSKHAARLYGTCGVKVMAWSKANRHPHVERLTKPIIRDYLARLNDTPYMRDQIKGYLSRLMRIAMDHDLIDRNPVEGIRFNDKKKQRTRENTGPWTHEEFEQRLQLCLDAGRPSIALALLIGYETGQRPESIDQFRRGHHYDEIRATFAYNQSKTNAYVAIPATERLKHWIGHYGGDDYLIVSEKTGRPYSSDALQDAFKTIQRRAGVEVLKRRYLRHTCVCRLADAGCDVPEIASVTGHTLSSANQILSHYWRPTQTQAANAIQRREQYENAERLRNRVQTMDQSESKLFAFEEEQNSRKPILKQVK